MTRFSIQRNAQRYVWEIRMSFNLEQLLARAGLVGEESEFNFVIQELILACEHSVHNRADLIHCAFDVKRETCDINVGERRISLDKH